MERFSLSTELYFVGRENIQQFFFIPRPPRYNFAIMLRMMEMGDLVFSRWPFFAMLWSLKGTMRHDFRLGVSLKEFLDSRAFVGAEIDDQPGRYELLAKPVSIDGRRYLDVSKIAHPSGAVSHTLTLSENLGKARDFEVWVPFSRFNEVVGAIGNVALAHMGGAAPSSGEDGGGVSVRGEDLSLQSWSVALREQAWGADFSISDSLKYLAKSGSDFHKQVFYALQNLPDIWWSEDDRENLRAFMRSDPGMQQSADGGSDPVPFTTPQNGLAYTVMVWGEKFSAFLGAFIRRFREVVGRESLLVFAMDKISTERCLENYVAAGCISGETRTIIHKFTIPWLLAKYGVDTMWIDFDVYFVQDPTPYLMQALHRSASPRPEPGKISTATSSTTGTDTGDSSTPPTSPSHKKPTFSHQHRPPHSLTPLSAKDNEDYEILITGSFASHCICNGVVYFRATDTVITWLLDVINWMYSHPYEHDQKCFAHWLDHTERVTFRPLPRSTPDVPKWALLESVEKFVTAAVVEGNGWMSDSWQNIVLFHWLHGDSDSAGASGDWLKTSDVYKRYHESVEGPSGEGGIMPPHFTMMDVFFGDDPVLSTDEMKVRALEASRQFERKVLLTEDQHCGVIGEAVAEHNELRDNLADNDKLIL